MNFTRILLSLTIATVVTGCANSPYAGRLNAQKPELKDAAGLYKFERETMHELTEIDTEYQSATILLNIDGTFKVSNVPCWTGGLGTDTTPVSSTGKWNIDVVGTVVNGWGYEKKYWGIILKPSPRCFPSDIGFMDDAPSYKLLLNYSDRDLDEVMIFGKR
jgi:hypothetical protein